MVVLTEVNMRTAIAVVPWYKQGKIKRSYNNILLGFFSLQNFHGK
jgi:hypothetical protein